jgi:hypothetical protein
MAGVEVATMSANSGGVSREGAIERDGTRYVISVAGRRTSGGGSLDLAAHRLASALRNALPRKRDPNWGVAVRCVLRPDVNLVFGNQAGSGGGGGGIPNPCVARIVNEYRGGDDNLDRALEFAARLLAKCCGN